MQWWGETARFNGFLRLNFCAELKISRHKIGTSGASICPTISKARNLSGYDIKTVTMDKYLIHIMERMLDTSDQTMEAGYVSSDTISWKASREAEKVENTDFVPQLVTFIDNEKDKNKRDKAYPSWPHCKEYR